MSSLTPDQQAEIARLIDDRELTGRHAVLIRQLQTAGGAGSPPIGPAGGVLSGTYPNPGFAVDMATQAELDAAIATYGDKTYVHTQASPSATWTVAHNLGKYPNAEAIDTGGSVIEGDLSYPNTNTLIITYSAATAGVAYLD